MEQTLSQVNVGVSPVKWYRQWKPLAAGLIGGALIVLASIGAVMFVQDHQMALTDHKRIDDVVAFLNQQITAAQKAAPTLPKPPAGGQ